MIRIGLLIAFEGPPGIWALSSELSAILAVAEINNTGGLLGRHVELVAINSGVTARSAAQAAADAVEIDGVDAIVAMVPSFARAPVAQRLNGRVPFVYTPQFEGHEADRSVVTVGETAEELLKPGIFWLSENKSAQRFFLVGTDYVWPRVTFAAARRIIRDMNGMVVGEKYLPFGHDDYDAALAEIRRSHADVVVPYLVGNDSITFHRAFAESGLAQQMLRFTSAVDETVLYGIGPENSENLYVTSAYFAALRSRNNDRFLENYHDAFGTTPPPASGFGQSCYEGIHCLAGLVRSAGALRVPELRRKVGRAVQGRTARGFESQVAAGAARPVHFAAVDGCDFRIVQRL
jgi:urea transport system substrate-binding protein